MGSVNVGDIVWKSENGDINSVAGSGWITPNEVGSETLDFDCETADDYKVHIINNIREICYKVVPNWLDAEGDIFRKLDMAEDKYCGC